MFINHYDNLKGQSRRAMVIANARTSSMVMEIHPCIIESYLMSESCWEITTTIGRKSNEGLISGKCVIKVSHRKVIGNEALLLKKKNFSRTHLKKQSATTKPF